MRTATSSSSLLRKAIPPRSPIALYHPSLEKDSCGVALLANLKGRASHAIVQDATTVLARMEHRGGCGCEPNTGDGSGILMGMPDDFMRKAADEIRTTLPPVGEYASGLVFASHDQQTREAQQRALVDAARSFGLTVLGWRRPPTDNFSLGATAVASEPHILQVFIGMHDSHVLNAFHKGDLTSGQDHFERLLYLTRKRASQLLDAHARSDFYVASLSARTITYKGQLTSYQLPLYYRDLKDPSMASHMAMVHSRFSTNTFPSWDRAQPNRMLCHNGEINTLRGNKNWIASRMGSMDVPFLGKMNLPRDALAPYTSDDKTDSGNLDAVLELLVRGSTDRSLPEAMMMMVPEAWQGTSPQTNPAKRAFYEFHANLMEPWDGPAMMAFTDGRLLGAVLDRNGLRPSRYYVTKDDRVLLSSEVGVLPELPPDMVKIKARLEPGKLFLVDFDRGEIVLDSELKDKLAKSRPYGEWLNSGPVRLEKWVESSTTISQQQQRRPFAISDLVRFGYTTETLDILMQPMAGTGKEALGSMGIDIPLAVLSSQPQLPFAYFKQLFAQVTNPPIDPIREELVMSLECPVGPEANLFTSPTPEHCTRLVVSHPILSDAQMEAMLASSKAKPYKGKWFANVLDCTFDEPSGGGAAAPLVNILDRICNEAVTAVKNNGVPILILSHAQASEHRLAVPSLLVTGAVHHRLIKEGLRTKCALFVDCGDAREVHDFCTLVGYGADGIRPFVAYRAVEHLWETGKLRGTKGSKSKEAALENMSHAIGKGMLKVMAKMGISTLQSYKGAQIFECVGLNETVVDKCFKGTPSRMAGAGFQQLYDDVLLMHRKAKEPHVRVPNPGEYHFRDRGEVHYNSPGNMASLQAAARAPTNSEQSREAYKKYSQETTELASKMSLRGLLEIVKAAKPVPLDQVEPVSEIVKRFCTGAMSLGSISAEAHETLAVAMNSMKARSNTGEGGEDPKRFTWTGSKGESKRSAIKQVASGRFGVTSHYLANADQLQIKMAQGAKPGEGGELPGYKVTAEIAAVRGTTPGVGLISPPPHHDIYSIEDLAQLIHDLKCANPDASVSVKLVSEVGVGVVAAGCVKAKADHVTISGGDGGTGAAAWTGVHKAGLPWELGLAETQQTLVLNDLRSRVRLQTDGQIKTARDVVVAALLGAEEVAFSTTPLIALGCIMMRKCHLNTCPVGIATQDPVLRRKFTGQPEHVTNFLFLLAEEVREYMAALGFKTFQDMVGRCDMLKIPTDRSSWPSDKARGLDLEHLLFPSARLNAKAGRVKTMDQDHKLDESLDNQLIALAKPALDGKEPVMMELPITNVDRSVGATLSYHVSKKYGALGLDPGTISIKLRGSAGQSLGFALARGIDIDVEGDANDYVGKSLSGGRIVVRPPRELMESSQEFNAQDNVIVGNVVMYGATSGSGFFRGKAGERFCVRNSGGLAVVEGVGDHGCEYMTGGRVVVLGETGRNFAAGMSGGIAWIYDVSGKFKERCNVDMVELSTMTPDSPYAEELREAIETHLRLTASSVARDVMSDWNGSVGKFVQVMPNDFKAVLEAQAAQAAVDSKVKVGVVPSSVKKQQSDVRV